MAKIEKKEKRIINLIIQVFVLLTAFLGLSAIVGWIFNIPQLASFDSSIIPMALSTAILFVVYGLIIFLHNTLHPSRIMFRIEVAISSAGILTAILFLYLSLNGIHPGAEHLGLKMSGAVDGLVIGHMSPVTAFSFLLVGLSFFIILLKPGQKKLIKISLIFAGIIFSISIILLLSYLLGTPLFYEGSFIPPAITTSLALLFLGIALLLISGLKVWSNEELSDVLSARYTYILALVFIVLILSVVTAGYSYYINYEKQFRSEIENKLSSIASLKVNQIVQWRKDRLGDAKVMFKNAEFSKLVNRFLNNQNDLEAKKGIQAWIDEVRTDYQYNQICLYNSKGFEVITSSDQKIHKPFNFSLSSSEALKAGQIFFQDFYRDENDNNIYLTILIPILSGKNIIGILVMRIDPEQYLYPLVNEWPALSKTAETLIVRREGNETVFLNELKFQKNTALNLRRPLTELNLPAVQAALGKKEFMEGVDYRGVPVIAYVCPIPNSPWFLVARIEISEVYAPLREWFWAIIIFVVVLLIGLGASIGLIWRDQRSKFHKERYQTTESIRKLNRVYAVLSNINEAIVRIRNPQELFEKACDIAIEKGGFQMALIGKFSSQTKKIDLAASKGVSEVHLKKIDFNCEGDQNLLCITGRVFKTGVHVISNDIQNDESILPLHKESVMYGSKSIAAFPLKVFGQVWGVFNLYSSEIGFFDEEEIKLLDELAMDISFAIEFDDKEAERKRAEEKLRQSELRFKQVSENAQEMIWEVDKNGLYTYASPVIKELLGYEPEEIVGKRHFYDLFVQESKEELKQAAFGVFARKESIKGFVNTNKHKDGREIILSTSGMSLLDSEGNFIGFRGVDKDITERKLAEIALKLSESQFRNIFENSPIGKSMTMIDGSIRTNKAFSDMLGYSLDEFQNKNWKEITHPDDIQKSTEAIEPLLKGEKLINKFEKRYIHKDGSIILTDIITTLQKDDQGKSSYFISSIIDITERKRAEEKIREKDIQFRKLSWQLPDLIFQFTRRPDGTYFVPIASEGIKNIFGCSPEDVREDFAPIGRVIFPGDSERVISDIEYSAKHLSLFTCEFRVQIPGKSIQWIYSKSIPEKLADGSITWYGFNTDITERKLAEKARKESEEKFRLVWEKSTEGMRITNEEGIVLLVNDAYCNLVGKPPDYIEGKLMSVVYEEARQVEILLKHEKQFHNRDIPSYLEKAITLWNGNKLFVEALSTFLEIENQPTLLLSIFKDISDRKLAEKELIESKEKAEEANRLKSNFLANMSHELRTPMVGILGYADILSSELKEPEHIEMADTILKSGNRLIDTLNSILDLSRIESNKMDINLIPVNLIEILDESVNLYKPMAYNKGLYLNYNFAPKPVYIKSDKEILVRIFNNIINNAIKFTHSGGITIKIFSPKNDSDKYIAVDIIDTGIGIPKEFNEIIYEPFRQVSEGFSRKFEGSGLGLSITRKIVELLDGSISFESTPGEGSTFSILFPLTKSKDEIPVTENKSSYVIETMLDKLSYKPSILLVEDDSVSASVICSYLKDYASVDHFFDGSEAVTQCKVKLYDAVLMDINLRGIDGVETLNLIREIREDYSKIPVVALTAYAMSGDKEKFLSLGFTHYLSKPFQGSQLLELLSAIFERSLLIS